MVLASMRPGGFVPRLIVGLVLLGYPAISNAAGSWTVISLPHQPAVTDPAALVVDAEGNLYIADQSSGGGVQKRDTQGNWSTIALAGTDLGQVDLPSALAIDATGELYVADVPGDWGSGRIQKRDAHGSWSLVAVSGTDSGQVTFSTWWGITAGLGVDTEGSLYVADGGAGGRVQKRDVQGDWSLVPLPSATPGQADTPTLLALDTAGNLYLVDQTRIGNVTSSKIQRRDAQGNWSLIAAYGASPTGLAVDGAGNLYVADTGNDRALMYKPAP